MTGSLSQSLGGAAPVTWATDFLNRAGFPVVPESLRVVVSWESAESGGGGGMFNPLNTTQGGYAGETDVNSVGVKNYARWDDGIAACAKVIHNGLYAQVVYAFTARAGAQTIVDAITSSPWGTRHIQLVPPVGPVPPAPKPPQPKKVTMPMMMSNSHGGYWVVHADGAVFALGGAEYHGGLNPGSHATLPAGHTVTGGAPSPSGRGYWLLGSDGAVYAFGDAVYHGGAPVTNP